MFATKGWKDLVEDLQRIKKSIRVEDIPDEQTLFVRKGELRLINYLLSLKEVSDKTYQDLQNEDSV